MCSGSVLDIPDAQQTSAHGQRLALAMKHVGWERNPSGRVTIDGSAVRGYVRRAAALNDKLKRTRTDSAARSILGDPVQFGRDRRA